jgi:hypothetical protein
VTTPLTVWPAVGEVMETSIGLSFPVAADA